MASTKFCEAVAYAPCCIGLKDLTLKPKQEEALIYMYDGHDVFAWFPTYLCLQLLPFMLREESAANSAR